MATHSGILDLKILQTEEPSGLQSMGQQRVGQDWSTTKHAEYIIWNARLDESQAGIEFARRNINNLRNIDDATLMAKSEEELKSLLMRVKEENEKVGLKLSFQNTKIMASSPITSWQIEGEKVEAVIDFLFLGSKITADSNCNHENYDKSR